MWPFSKAAPLRKFGIGEKVRLVDSAHWDNENTRHLIGREALVVTYDLPRDLGFPPEAIVYGVEVSGHVAHPFFCSEPSMRRIDEAGDPYAEPRDIGDDTPNKVIAWDRVQWQPHKEKI